MCDCFLLSVEGRVEVLCAFWGFIFLKLKVSVMIEFDE